MTCVKSDKTTKSTFRQQIREAAEQLDLPEGFLHGQPLLTLDGDLQLMVERHLGITEYGEQQICIAARRYTIRIRGERLYLTAMDQECIRIRGHIVSVDYLYRE